MAGSEALPRQIRPSQHPEDILVKIFLVLLEAENLKSKDLANEHPALMPADVAAVVDSLEFRYHRIDVLN
jgi:hypothetical protein